MSLIWIAPLGSSTWKSQVCALFRSTGIGYTLCPQLGKEVVSSSPASLENISFGVFEANLRSRELRRKGVKVRLPDQSFQVLAMLLEHPGELVAREDIRKRLWPVDTFVDFDHGLNNAVNRLREALGDSTESPRLIETLPRRGYRFIAAVNCLAKGGNAAAAESPDMSGQASEQRLLKGFESERRSPPYARIVVAVAAIVVVALAALMFRAGRIAKPPRIRSLAVLPLQNLSGDASQDYFADGMTDALITYFANISSLRVISRSSAMHYKGSHLALPQIARELNVDAVVEGSVVRSGDRVRVTAQLVEAPSDRQLWAKAYDRQMREILWVQQDLAQNIVREIQAKLTPTEEARLSAKAEDVNPEAYSSYLLGRSFWNTRSLDGYQKGLEFFKHATELSPEYAPAYAGVADCYNHLGLGMGSLSAIEAAKLARAAEEKALQLDQNLAEAHAALAFTLHRYDWNWADSEKEFMRAIELDPQNATFHTWFSELLGSLGRTQEAQAHSNRARVIDPLSVQGVRQIAHAYVENKQYDKVTEYYSKAIELQPDSFRLRMDLATGYRSSGHYQEAVEEFQKVIALYGPNVFPEAELGYTYALSGRRSEAVKVIGDLKRTGRPGYSSYALARIFVALGRKDEAFTWLERAYEERAAQMPKLNGDSAFASLHSEPRFQDLVRRVGLPPE